MIESGHPAPKSVLMGYYRRLLSCAIHKTFASSVLEMHDRVLCEKSTISRYDYRNSNLSTFDIGDDPAVKKTDGGRKFLTIRGEYFANRRG